MSIFLFKYSIVKKVYIFLFLDFVEFELADELDASMSELFNMDADDNSPDEV